MSRADCGAVLTQAAPAPVDTPSAINIPDVHACFMAVFDACKRALGDSDVATLDGRCGHAALPIRYGSSENLYAIEVIRAFRAARGLARELRNGVITSFGTVMTGYWRPSFGNASIGRQRQMWLRTVAGVSSRRMSARSRAEAPASLPPCDRTASAVALPAGRYVRRDRMRRANACRWTSDGPS